MYDRTEILIDKGSLQKALAALGMGLERYWYIQSTYDKVDVMKNREFQRKFVGFYRVRRNEIWQRIFFELLERAKLENFDFAFALNKLFRRTGRIEASFASKLIATRYPDKPVWDRYLLEHLGLKCPGYHLPKDQRLEKSMQLYEELETKMSDLSMSKAGKHIVEAFDRKYPSYQNISTIKKLDLVLWQMR